MIRAKETVWSVLAPWVIGYVVVVMLAWSAAFVAVHVFGYEQAPSTYGQLHPDVGHVDPDSPEADEGWAGGNH